MIFEFVGLPVGPDRGTKSYEMEEGNGMGMWLGFRSDSLFLMWKLDLGGGVPGDSVSPSETQGCAGPSLKREKFGYYLHLNKRTDM
jgi:hypothetical protein